MEDILDIVVFGIRVLHCDTSTQFLVIEYIKMRDKRCVPIKSVYKIVVMVYCHKNTENSWPEFTNSKDFSF